MKCDLHTHSIFSDGTCSPEEIIRLAEEAGLDAVALTDHNTFDGLPRFMAAGEKSMVRTVPGIEISTNWIHPETDEVHEIHVVGLEIPVEGSEELVGVLDAYRRRKAESNENLARRLAMAGIEIDLEEIKKSTPAENINRAFFAEEIVKQGFAKTMQEAFRIYLEPGGDFYEPPTRMSVQEAVDAIIASGGHPIFAHPMLTFKDDADVRLVLDEVSGFEGIEVFYPAHTVDASHAVKLIAEDYGLRKSGGSDFHGERKKHIRLGDAFVTI